jgi:hypothetical protein
VLVASRFVEREIVDPKQLLYQRATGVQHIHLERGEVSKVIDGLGSRSELTS